MSNGLNAWGVFGPILGNVMMDSLKGKVIWSHWEQGPDGPLAVFRYQVPEEKSHYQVKYCCFPVAPSPGSLGEFPGLFNRVPGYHGELAIDPASGTIVRLVLQTELEPSLPIVRADVLVEYGPMEIGGKTYICPVKSVSISRSAIPGVSRTRAETDASAGPKMTALNDVVFRDYHMFRAETRILTGDSPDAGGNLPVPVPTDAPSAAPAPAPRQ